MMILTAYFSSILSAPGVKYVLCSAQREPKRKNRPSALYVTLMALCLVLTFSACSRIDVDLRSGGILESQRHKQERESLQAAMDSYTKGAYPEAKAQFRQLVDTTSTPEIKEQAHLGAILSTILSADTLEDIQGPEKELEEFREQSSSLKGMDIVLIRPFVQKLRENIVLKEENQVIHKKYKAAKNKIHNLKQKQKDLTGQIQELEELFNLIEEQKSRQLLNSQ